MVGFLGIPNHEFAFSSRSLLLHLFVLLTSVRVTKYDYLIPRCFVLSVASLVFSYTLSVGPLSFIFSKSGKSARTTLHNPVEGNTIYQN